MKTVAMKVCGTLQISYQGKDIDLSHWERMTMIEAVKKYSGVDFAAISSDEEAIALAKAHERRAAGDCPPRVPSWPSSSTPFVEENLIQPTFIYDVSRGEQPPGQAEAR